MARRPNQQTSHGLTYERLEVRQVLAAAADLGGAIWQPADLEAVRQIPGENYIQPSAFQLYQLEMQEVRQVLSQAPLEFTHQALTPFVFSLPTPAGHLAKFYLVESPIMAPALADKFPTIKTYRGQGVDNAAATVRLDVTEQGFHAQVLSPDGAYFVDPYYHLNDEYYMSYFKRDLDPPELHREGDCGCSCGACRVIPSDDPSAFAVRAPFAAIPPSGDQLFVYDLAVGATGEYTTFHGGTVAAGLSAIVTAVNRVTGVYEIDLTIRMQLVANNNLVVYTNPATDPYTNNNGVTMLGQNQVTMDNVIGSANYDIGHVFSTGGGGVASLGVVGVNGSKARGVTGQNAPIGDPFYIDYVAHEMGHQYGANHTFNGDSGSCAGGNRNASTAYEPGSGSTIMAYAGICGNDNLQLNSDPVFHFISQQEIRNYVSGGAGFASATKINTGNSIPTVDAGLNYVIPDQTPFMLTAVGSDANGGDVLTYTWEERDLGPQQDVNAIDNGSSPLFRSWTPTTNPVRYLPRLSNILNNTTVIGEKYAMTNRTLNFRVTVRDNRSGGGGNNSDDMSITVVNSGTGFLITNLNAAGTNWIGNTSETVTWNVSGTNAGAINTPNVDILFSSDGGNTFSTVLASAVPNDGSHNIVVPNVTTAQGRIMVRGTGNIFFDINNANIDVQTGGGGGLNIETGVFAANGNWKTVTLNKTFANPVVNVSPVTYNGADPSTIAIRNVTSSSFQIKVREWNYLNDAHTPEDIGYIVMEAGVHTLTDGTQIVAGIGEARSNWTTVGLGATLGSVPAVIVTLASANGSDVVAPRIRNMSSSDFQISLREEEANNGNHGKEAIHYMAMTQGSGSSDGLAYESVITPRSVTHNPYVVNFAQSFSGTPIFLGTISSFYGVDTIALRTTSLSASSATFFLEEEQSFDPEVTHGSEIVSYIALEFTGAARGAVAVSSTWDAAHQRMAASAQDGRGVYDYIQVDADARQQALAVLPTTRQTTSMESAPRFAASSGAVSAEFADPLRVGLSQSSELALFSTESTASRSAAGVVDEAVAGGVGDFWNPNWLAAEWA